MHSCWRSWGRSMIGPLHQKNGLPNQDAWLARHYSWGDVVVVSDGLGSKPHADTGAKMACRAVCEAAKFYQKNTSAPLEELTRLIHAMWLIFISPYCARDCAATCLFVLRIHEDIIAGQLGDGMIVLYAEQPEHNTLIADSKDASFSNVTLALTETYQAGQWMVFRRKAENYQAILLCTDGISDDLRPEQQIPFTEALFCQYQRLPNQAIKKDLMHWLNAWPVQYHSDDKTIACLSRKGVLLP